MMGGVDMQSTPLLDLKGISPDIFLLRRIVGLDFFNPVTKYNFQITNADHVYFVKLVAFRFLISL